MRLGACRNGWPASEMKRKRRAESDRRGGLEMNWQRYYHQRQCTRP
jgi:hypothetical protein